MDDASLFWTHSVAKGTSDPFLDIFLAAQWGVGVFGIGPLPVERAFFWPYVRALPF